MRKTIAAALVVAPVLLTACASSARHAADASFAERTRASCERTIYHTSDYDQSTGLTCAQLLGVWD